MKKMKKHLMIFFICLICAVPVLLLGQESSAQQTAGSDNTVSTEGQPQNLSTDDPRGADPLTTAKSRVQQQLEQSLAQLSALREQMAAEKVPLSRQLSELESELINVRLEYQKTARLLDSRTLDISNLRNQIKSRKEEITYLSNLLSEYARNFESRLHIAEIQRYREALDKARLAVDSSNLSQEDIFQLQTNLITTSLQRNYEMVGGTSFQGKAVDDEGLVKDGTFILVGPSALFRSEDGQEVGAAQQRLGSLEPTIIPFLKEEDTQAAAQVVTNQSGYIPLDPTLGNAHKMEATQETFLQHVQKGGVVMIPIFVMAGAACLVALYKWLSLSLVRMPSQKRIHRFLDVVKNEGQRRAQEEAEAMRGPVGKMLAAGVEHMDEPRELIEEVMYEKVMATRLKLQGLLPFVAISASSAPLLGLLGTVTGIINTFKLITVFGSGDVKTLSGGISEALITTEFGLIVAIPSLLLHAFLSRKAKGIVDKMEKIAVNFLNYTSTLDYDTNYYDRHGKQAGHRDNEGDNLKMNVATR
jgi:biopolymer transport protein ExbB